MAHSNVKVILSHFHQFVNDVDKGIKIIEEHQDPVELCTAYQEVKEVYAAFDTILTQLYHVKNNLDKVAIPQLFENKDLEKISVPKLALSFYIIPKYSASMLDREKAFKWLRKQNAGALITETVNAGTLASFFKERLIEKGAEAPAEIFKFTEYKTTGSSKYNPKKELKKS